MTLDSICHAESAKVMATPTGLRQSSRDLGFPPQEQGQAQEGLPDLPPGFTYTQLESMIRELRTAAALEVQGQLKCSCCAVLCCAVLCWRGQVSSCVVGICFKPACLPALCFHWSPGLRVCLSVRLSINPTECVCYEGLTSCYRVTHTYQDLVSNHAHAFKNKRDNMKT